MCGKHTRGGDTRDNQHADLNQHFDVNHHLDNDQHLDNHHHVDGTAYRTAYGTANNTACVIMSWWTRIKRSRPLST